jgi:uncharacterized protein YraI
MPRLNHPAGVIRTVTAAVAAVAAVLLVASPALADPATTVSYPARASATMYTGLAFETCAAPSLAAMQAWSASPYRGVGVYIGGVNRTCAQPELIVAWVSAVSQLSWRLLPVYKGLQPQCGGKATDQKISLTPATAASQGTAAANDAAARVRALGMVEGSAIYNDIENYNSANTACRASVLTYLSAWTRRLHQLGYVSGVYANLASGAPDMSSVYFSASYARPDALWLARYDLNPSLTGWAGIPDTRWSANQRAKQYRGGHNETYGGVTINIDNDNVSAPVATVAYPYTVTSSTGLNARSGPGTSYPVVKAYPAGAPVSVVCQTAGTKVTTTSVWDKLTDGSYVTDYYISTPSNTGYSGLATRCQYPYQVTPRTGANERKGPGTSYSLAGHLNGGALAWVWCQRSGTKIGTTKVWDKLRDGLWVSDYYVATPSNTTYSKPVPRC